MNELKEQKEKELLKTIADYKTMLSKAEELEKALADYDKNIINKTFFEKYFTELFTEEYKTWSDYKLGEPIIRNGVKRTTFFFSDKPYKWADYSKRIWLFRQEYIEVKATDKATVRRATAEKIETLKIWLDNATKHLEEVQATDEETIKREIIAIYNKYKPSLWSEILNSYEVKYPKDTTEQI